MNKKFVLLLFFVSLFFLTGVHAQEENGAIGNIEITPKVIDEQASARDLFKYEVKIKNNSNRKHDYQIIINDITNEGGEVSVFQNNDLDRKTSIASWVKIKRATIELMPGEEIIEPLEIDVSQYAIPGKYYASIVFGRGSNITTARESAKNNSAPKILVNIEVKDNIVEKSQMKKFSADKTVFLFPGVTFSTYVKNVGNTEVLPLGKIMFYDRKNSFVEEINFNEEGNLVGAGEEKKFATEWKDFFKPGKYKAKIEVEYGNKNKLQLQDTVFFWIIPWYFLLFFFLVTFGLLSFLAILIFKKTYHPHLNNNSHNQNHSQSKEKEHVIDLR